jgi:mono/diheme cytochrome c family protein
VRIALALAMAGATAPGFGLAQETPQDDPVARGEYLVTTSGCHDCHTPWIMGANGPEPDMSRALSGHPQDIAIDAPGQLPEPWIGGMNATNTAWTGPWGVSFSANLTPDPETGIWREMDEEQFIEALRTGRHLGQGRAILPPMPWPMYGQMEDADLQAIYAYLQTITPVTNAVPDPIAPAQ